MTLKNDGQKFVHLVDPDKNVDILYNNCPSADSTAFIYIYIYAFSRRFYPKWLTLHSSYSFTFYQLLLSLGIEPMILALLAPCSTIWATGKPVWCPYWLLCFMFIVDIYGVHYKLMSFWKVAIPLHCSLVMLNCAACVLESECWPLPSPQSKTEELFELFSIIALTL